MKLTDDDLDMVIGGQNLLYRGEKVNKNSLLLDDTVSTQPINLLKRDSVATKRFGGRTDGIMSC